MTTKEKALTLERISFYENTELGEYWITIVELYLYSKDYMSSEVFHTQIGVEIEIEYLNALDMIEHQEIEMPEEVLEEIIEDYKGTIV